MGILPSGKGKEPSPTTGKRASRQMDFSNLPPLRSTGTVGFTSFRDGESSGAKKSRKKSNGNMALAGTGDDSDDDEDEDVKLEEANTMDDDKEVNTLLSPEDSKFSGELVEGVNRIKVYFPSRNTEIKPTNI